MPTAKSLRLPPGLLKPAQFRELRTRLEEPHALIAELLSRGWLTPYQARQLRRGRSGKLVLGRYVVLDRLGAGATGKVYKVRHRDLDRLAALKVLRRQGLEDPVAAARFRREVETVAQLAHPHIVRAYDAGQNGDRYFLVTEYVPGPDLGRRVAEGGPLTLAAACKYARQAALGLQHAHQRGLVHRDIKPSNLLLQEETGLVKVADFGLARLQHQAGDPLTQQGAVLGTLDYMAPEQTLDSHAVDARADLYSLGCTLYYLLTGRPPFPGGTALRKLFRHQDEEPTPVEQVRPGVPDGVAAVVRRLMAKRPGERYQTAGEAAAALAAVTQPWKDPCGEGSQESPLGEDFPAPAFAFLATGLVGRRAGWGLGNGLWGVVATLAAWMVGA